MSKRSQREAREKREQDFAERDAKFSSAVERWIQIFVEYYKQEPPTEMAVLAYRAALKHLTPEELNMGCTEALKVCEFPPRATDILAGLRVARERIGAYGHSPTQPEGADLMSKEERAAIGRQILAAGRKLTMPKGNREAGDD